MKIAVVGAGVMGQVLAWTLHQANFHVTLFDKGNTRTCSSVAAGMLSPVSELEKNDKLIYDLGRESLDTLWPKLLNDIEAKGVLFRQQGTLFVSANEDAQRLQNVIATIREKVPHEPILNGAAYTHCENSAYVPHEGQIDSQALLLHLRDYLQKNRCYQQASIHGIENHRLKTETAEYAFDWIMDCRGLGSQASMPTLRGVRGEIIWLQCRENITDIPIRFYHPRYPMYMVPRANGIVIVGATEVESSDESPISVRATLELLSAAYHIHRSIAEARIVKTDTHVRPTLMHHLPQIAVHGRHVIINGLYRHGFLIAPALAQDVLRYLVKGKTSLKYSQIWEHDDANNAR